LLERFLAQYFLLGLPPDAPPLLLGDDVLPLLLGEEVLPLAEEPPLELPEDLSLELPAAPALSPAWSGAAACSSGESLPSWFLSSLAKSFSCGVPFTSSRERKPSLFLSSDLNIFSAPDCEEPEAAEPDEPEAAAPDEPDAEEPLELGEAALGALLEPAAEPLPADLSLLDALSPAACASDVAKAAAIAAAIRVLSFMQILLQGERCAANNCEQ
jgi:hypothetical protein